MNELYKKIKNRREELGYTQKYMADSLAIDAATYSRIENSKMDITVSRLELIASLLKVDASSLLAQHAIASDAKKEMVKSPKVIIQLELDDDVKADVIKLAFGKRVLEISNK